jgi:hypothetical protein
MTPLAMRFANELTLPKNRRAADDRAGLLGLIGRDLHCFEVSAVAKHVHDAMDLDNVWPEVESMAPGMFLPSPVTWLEMAISAKRTRLAWVLEDAGGGSFRMSMAGEGPEAPYSLPVCIFRARGVLELGERIEQTSLVEQAFVKDEEKPSLATAFMGAPTTREQELQARIGLLQLEIAKHEREKQFLDGILGGASEFINHGIAFSVLALDLINTPGLVGLRQHDPHRGLARKLYATRSGSYPLRGWSEIVLKHQTRIADDPERHTGATFHKCLHFVRSHLRHYRDGKVTVIPAHWRGDPALGIKRTRYLVAA